MACQGRAPCASPRCSAQSPLPSTAARLCPAAAPALSAPRSTRPPRRQVQKSLVYLGANQRLRRVVHDLMVGKPVRVGAIGGSITHGAKASKIGDTDWFRRAGQRAGRRRRWGRWLVDGWVGRGCWPSLRRSATWGALPAAPPRALGKRVRPDGYHPCHSPCATRPRLPAPPTHPAARLAPLLPTLPSQPGWPVPARRVPARQHHAAQRRAAGDAVGANEHVLGDLRGRGWAGWGAQGLRRWRGVAWDGVGWWWGCGWVRCQRAGMRSACSPRGAANSALPRPPPPHPPGCPRQTWTSCLSSTAQTTGQTRERRRAAGARGRPHKKGGGRHRGQEACGAHGARESQARLLRRLSPPAHDQRIVHASTCRAARCAQARPNQAQGV